MFLRHLQPPSPKNFIAFPVFTMKNPLYIAKFVSLSFTWIHHFYSILLKKEK